MVLLGGEGTFAEPVEEARRCEAGGVAAVTVVGFDFAACDVAAVGDMIELVWRCFGGDGLDSLVNYCFLQGYAYMIRLRRIYNF